MEVRKDGGGPASRRMAGPLLVAAAASWLILTGIVGLGRHAGFSGSNFDMGFLYTAGRCWLRSSSPYDLPTFLAAAPPGVTVNESGYAYPPQSAWLSVSLAWFPFDGARAVMTLVNLACVGVIGWLCAGPLLRRHGGRAPTELAPWLVWAIVLGNPFTSHVLYMGQTSLLAGAALLAYWAAESRNKPWIAGALLALASLKPQLAFLCVLWTLLERRWKTLAAMAAVATLLSTPSWSAGGPWEALRQWVSALGTYGKAGPNVATFLHTFGVQSLLTSVGLRVPSLLPFVVLATFLLWLRGRRRLEREDLLPIVLGLSLLFVYAHDYDLSVLAPLAPALILRCAGNRALTIRVAVLALVLFIPIRWLKGLSNPILLQYRVPVVLALLGILLVLCWKEGRERSPAVSLAPTPSA